MVKLNKIYTRTGDDGSTGMVDGSRVAKDSALVCAIGDVDELNATLGQCALHSDSALLALLRRVQNDLFDLGADLATPPNVPYEALRIHASQITRLEHEIDAITATIAPLTSFILPGGSALASTLHIARCVARRAERSAIAAAQEGDISPLALAYLNRLSDWLFVMGREANDHGAADILWVPAANRA
jgi:cob(I)alamin adenosyltransferase